MRTKARSGRARPRLSKLPSHTPTVTTRSLRFLNLKPIFEGANGNHGVDKIELDVDNTESAYGDDEETDGTKMPGDGLGCSGECSDMDSVEGGSCITCNRVGDNLLVCSESGCPIALHRKCMNCGPKFDDLGNFYCPYCWYKLEVARTRGMRKKAMEAKNALSRFLDFKMVVGNGENDGGTAKGKELNKSPLVGDRNGIDGVDREKNDSMDCQFVEADKGQEKDGENVKGGDPFGHFQGKKAVQHQSESLAPFLHAGRNTSQGPGVDSISKERSTKEDASRTQEHEILGDGENCRVEDLGQVDDSGNKRIANDRLQAEPCAASCVEEENFVDDSRHLSEALKLNMERREEEKEIESSGTESSNFDTETILEHQSRVRKRLKMKGSRNINSPKKLSSPVNATSKRISRTQNQKVTASHKSRQRVAAAEKFTNLAFGKEKRKRLQWTEEEEEMLKEGVKRFSTKVNKNLPWRKILEFGHHIFDPTRNPTDLKDKWRNIMAKESSAINRS